MRQTSNESDEVSRVRVDGNQGTQAGYDGGVLWHWRASPRVSGSGQARITKRHHADQPNMLQFTHTLLLAFFHDTRSFLSAAGGGEHSRLTNTTTQSASLSQGLHTRPWCLLTSSNRAACMIEQHSGAAWRGRAQQCWPYLRHTAPANPKGACWSAPAIGDSNSVQQIACRSWLV